MRLDTSMSQRLDQRMILAPRMIQSMEILQLPIMALQERIEHELGENPVLELKETGTDPEDVGSSSAPDDDEPMLQPAEESTPVVDPEKELVIDDKGDNEQDFDRLVAINDDWADHFNEEHRPSPNRISEENDKKHDAMVNMASRPQSLQDYLNDQLAFVDAPEGELALIRHVIAHVNKNGYLGFTDESEHYQPFTLEDMARSFGSEVTAEQVEAALRKVQHLDPPGVGARDLKECLILQITPETPHRDVLRLLIQNHLEDIQHNRLPIIQKKTGFDLETIQEAIEILKHLNPKPGSQYTADNIPYVVPDIVVELGETGQYEVRLLDDWTPNIYISNALPQYSPVSPSSTTMSGTT